jgi:riboflavin kinase / FMN adenylyltransferase
LKTFHSISEFTNNKKTIVTLGTFDGVHKGHQKILNRLKDAMSSQSLESVVLTFSQHPRSVLHNDSNIRLLNTNDEKVILLQQKGIDNLIIQDFNAEFSELSGEEFVKNILVDKLNIQKIIIGYDHRFGKNRSSDIHDLIYFGKKYHFDVEQISAKEVDEISVSSTKIRNAISDGQIKLANKYLGYQYFFSGKVVQGNQLGRTIGFPTANILVENKQKMLPKNGVYIVEVILHDEVYKGMMNIGNKPTVDGFNFSVEVNIFDFEKDIYNLNITISVVDFIRNEIKFDSIESLKGQLIKDKQFSQKHFSHF